GLRDGQRPSPDRRPMEPVNGLLGLGSVGHLDKAKAARPARVPIRDDPGALNNAIGLEQLAQLFFGRRIRQIRDVDTHGLTPVALAKEVCIYLEGCMPSNSL